MPADQAELHRRAVEEFGARVKAVADDQWELPTPCSDWNVRQLVNHLVYENRWTVPLMGGSTIAEVGEKFGAVAMPNVAHSLSLLITDQCGRRAGVG